MAGNDPWANYPKGVREKLKGSKIIEDAIRNCKARGYDKNYAQKVSGAPFEVVDRVYNDKNPHDTGKRHSDDD